MTGTLHLVGVGPGDPELLTIKAARLLSTMPVIACPSTGEGSTLALDIARPHCNPAAIMLPVAIPMRVERDPARTAYDAAADAIFAHLAEGRDVAWLCEGDPLFYGSAMYLAERLAGRASVNVVPGITSLTAVAATLALPLAGRNETLKVLPAPLETDRLRAELLGADTVALIKIGRHFDRIRDLLVETGRAARARVVEHATTPRQRIARLDEYGPGERPYFSLILAPAPETAR